MPEGGRVPEERPDAAGPSGRDKDKDKDKDEAW